MKYAGVTVQAKWKNIGIALGVKATDLESIEAEEGCKKDATQHCMQRVFQKWQSARTSECTWEKLSAVLKSRAVDEQVAVLELYKSLLELQNK